MLTNFAVRFSIWRICNCQTSWLQETDKIVRTGVRLLEWDSVTHCIKIKRPEHLSFKQSLPPSHLGNVQTSLTLLSVCRRLSIVERLGGFWWSNGTAFIWNNQTFLKKKNKVSLRNRHFTLKCHSFPCLFESIEDIEATLSDNDDNADYWNHNMWHQGI